MTSHVNSFFVGEADHCERMLSILEYCGTIGMGNMSTLESNKDWNTLSLNDDTIFNALEKGMYYKGMLALNDSSLLEKTSAITKKFSEIREKVDVVNTCIEISRGSHEEVNDSIQSIIAKIAKLSKLSWPWIIFMTSL